VRSNDCSLAMAELMEVLLDTRVSIFFVTYEQLYKKKSVSNTQTRKRVTMLSGSIFIHNRTALLCPLRVLMAKRHHIYSNTLILSYMTLRVKQSLYRAGQTLRVP